MTNGKLRVKGLTQIGNTQPPVSLLDPDAQSFIDAAMITNPTQISAINNFVINSKNFEIWGKLRAIYPFVGGTAFSHKWNLKDPRDLDEAYRLVFFGGVTHNFEGVQGNGVNGHADTFLSHNSTRNTGGISSYILNNIAEQSATIRVEISGSLITQILPRWTDNFAYFRAYSSSSISIPNTDSKGFFGISRIDNNTVVVNLKGSTTTHNNAVATIPATDRSYYIMAANFQNTVNRPGTHKIAFTTIHDGMNAVDLENLRIAIQIFQTELGRSIGTQTVSDPDAQNFINNAQINYQVESNAINNIVTSLKEFNLWSKVKVLYPFVGGTAFSHKFNLKDPRDLDIAYRLSFFGGITHTSLGVIPNGINGYARTYLPFNNTEFNNESLNLAYYSRTNTLEANAKGAVMGALRTTSSPTWGSFLIIRQNNTSVGPFSGFRAQFSNSANYVLNSNTVTDGSGLYIGNLLNNNFSLWRNGTQINDSNIPLSPIVLQNLECYLFCYNQNGAPQVYTLKTSSFASVLLGLTTQELINFNSIVHNFQIELGRSL